MGNEEGCGALHQGWEGSQRAAASCGGLCRGGGCCRRLKRGVEGGFATAQEDSAGAAELYRSGKGCVGHRCLHQHRGGVRAPAHQVLHIGGALQCQTFCPGCCSWCARQCSSHFTHFQDAVRSLPQAIGLNRWPHDMRLHVKTMQSDHHQPKHSASGRAKRQRHKEPYK